MNNKNIISLMILIVLSITYCNAQYMRMSGNSNIGGSFFSSKEGQGLKLDYNKYTSPTFVISPSIFYEWGNPLQSEYKNIGADMLFGLIPFDMGQKFALFTKVGITGQYESLSGLSEDIKGFSIGAKGGVELEYNISQSLSFSTYAYQAYLLKKTFGNTYYHIGLGIKLNLFSY